MGELGDRDAEVSWLHVLHFHIYSCIYTHPREETVGIVITPSNIGRY